MNWIFTICMLLLLLAHGVLVGTTWGLNPKTRFAKIRNEADVCADSDKKYRRQELPETDASAYVAMERCFVGRQTLEEENEEETP